jgi:hypothetical protein
VAHAPHITEIVSLWWIEDLCTLERVKEPTFTANVETTTLSQMLGALSHSLLLLCVGMTHSNACTHQHSTLPLVMLNIGDAQQVLG